MDDLRLTQIPVTETGMLIRKPVSDVFEALVNPDITTRFWFTRSTGRLEPGREVRWDWEMYGVSVPVTARAIEPGKRTVIEWPGYGGHTTVEWTFAPQKDGTTFVGVVESGFTGDGDELVRQVTDSTQGFSLVLAGLNGASLGGQPLGGASSVSLGHALESRAVIPDMTASVYVGVLSALLLSGWPKLR